MSAVSPIKPVRRRGAGGVTLGIDTPLLIATIFLVLFGLVMVFSASWELSYLFYDSHTYMFGRQVLYMILGLIVAGAATFLDYHHYRRLSVPAIILTLISLFAVVFIIREQRFNATRSVWQGSIMPSEAAKLVIVIYLCVWLFSKRHILHNIKLGLIPLMVNVGVVAGLIMLQPDISAAFTLVLLGGILFFLAGGEIKQIFVLLMGVLVVGWLVVQFQPTANARMTDYLNGLNDPSQASFHVRRSVEAFVRGGVFGTGIDRSETKLQGLPVPPTDSIFAVVAEETGLIGTTALIVLYAIVAWRGMKIAQNAPDLLGQLIAAGLTFWLVLEAIINMSMMVGLLPFAGNALPFISQGGSSLVVSLTSIGILMNISRQSRAVAATEERKIYAPDGFSRGKRRRDLSRTGRTASPR